MSQIVIDVRVTKHGPVDDGDEPRGIARTGRLDRRPFIGRPIPTPRAELADGPDVPSIDDDAAHIAGVFALQFLLRVGPQFERLRVENLHVALQSQPQQIPIDRQRVDTALVLREAR